MATVVALVLVLATPWRSAGANPPRALTGIVVYVDDGDTIDVRLGDRVERVRYIGIDAPEIAHGPGRGWRAAAPGGAAAARLNADLVAGRLVRLELDIETRDRYGRLLAYVWVGHTMVNAELVARGYARAVAIAPNLRHAAWLAGLEAQARAARRGLWRGSHGGFIAPAMPRSYHTARAPPSRERRLWRSRRISRSTPSTGCSRGPSSSPASRRWSAYRSISTWPTVVVACTPPP